ncbi:hypothetical protein [Hyalangium gracile]|uniref:hypothetical protein n=1 Tax=Hyalangium gracile TaxID=394092 RepID=UPI001CCB009A|nr:hypothetical protein [Hyalangium gracile]
MAEPLPYVEPVCDASCDALVGQYRFTFQDTSSVGEGCNEVGLVLPQEFVISRKGDVLATQVQGLALSGPYHKAPTHDVSLGGEGTVVLAGGKSHPINIVIDGTFAKVPATPQEPATITGRYYAFRVGNSAEPAGTPACSIYRTFSASR